MKNSRLTLYWLIFLLIMCSPKKQETSINQLDNGQYAIQHSNLSFLIDPNLGARVISAKLKGNELLLQKREKLLNWGATFWPSPQSDWNWPPPYAIHFGPYGAEKSSNKLVLQGETDPKIGLTVKKTFFVNDARNCLEIAYHLTNDSDSLCMVGPWEIVCVPAVGARVFFPHGQTPDDVDNTLKFQNIDGIGWFNFDTAPLKDNYKLFNNATEGWIGHINRDNILFVKTFEVIPPEELPPGQGNVEVYASKPFEYIELENHGRYRDLAPSEQLQYNVRWYLSELPDKFQNGQYNRELIDYVRSLIN